MATNKKLEQLNEKFAADKAKLLAEQKEQIAIDKSYAEAEHDTGCPYCGSYEGDATECPECGHGQ